MLPKEHGAYGQLLFPIVTAVAMGRPSIAALALIVTSTAIFLAHEPLLVLAGARGLRARRDDGARARRWLVTLAGVSALSGLASWITMPAGSRWTLSVPLAAAVVAAAWSVRGQERTTAGEISAGVALTSVAFPVGIAAGLSLPLAAGCVVAFVTGTITATMSVRSLIGRFRSAAGGPAEAPSVTVVAVLSLLLVALNALAASEGWIHRGGFWAGLPVTGVAVALGVLAPPPKFLRRVGWSLIAATAVASVVLVVSGRLG